MSDKGKRIDELAKAVGELGDDDGENVLAAVLAEARADDSLFTGGRPATVTREELEQIVTELAAVKRKTVAQKRLLELARAKLRVGAYVGSEAERWRAQRRAEALLGPLPPVESDAP